MTCDDKSNPALGSDPIAAAIRSKLTSTIVSPGLYIVATPIGNLADITVRALAVLARADIIACEDTRVTAKLKSAFGISTSLVSYHDHSAAKVGGSLIKRLKDGQIVALVSDAGTPLISDPGFRLVGGAIESNIPVFTVPGPSAAVAALVSAGLPTNQFFFGGFLPPKAVARRRALTDLAQVPATLILYESPKRLGGALADMADALGAREAAVARELTKRHEEIRRGSLSELAQHYSGRNSPKGEIVIVIAPPEPGPAVAADEIDRLLISALRHNSVRDAAADVATETGWTKRRVYQRALAIRAMDNDPVDDHES